MAFERGGKARPISRTDGSWSTTRLGRSRRGRRLGIAYTLEALAEPFLRSGQLVQVPGAWSPAFEGLFLYYPGRPRIPAVLRAFIDSIRVAGTASAKRARENPFATG